MANAPERTDAAVTASPGTYPEGLAPPPEPARDGAAGESYRPVSGLAMAGLGMALLFALAVLAGGVMALLARSQNLVLALLVLAPVGGALAAVLARKSGAAVLAKWAAAALLGLIFILGLGGLVAFTSASPWDLPWVAWALPVGALLACWVARANIARSEGTLEGEGLARWGIRVALFFSLIFGAYSLANSFAVRNQAELAALEFLQLTSQGKLAEAFLRGIPENQRPPVSSINEFLEAKNRAVNLQTPGAFSTFSENDVVRLLALAGTSNKFERVQVSPPVYELGSYTIEMHYRVTNSFGVFEVAVTCKSNDYAQQGARKRGWAVDLRGLRFVREVSSTPESERALRLAERARYAAQRWTSLTNQGLSALAVLETVEPSRRATLAPSGMVEALGVAPWLGLTTSEYRELIGEYSRGGLVNTDSSWVIPDHRTNVHRAAAHLFAHPAPSVQTIIPPVRLPVSLSREGGKTLVGVTMRCMLALPGRPEMPYILECTLVLETDDADSEMRLRQLRLVRGQTAYDGPPEGRPGGG